MNKFIFAILVLPFLVSCATMSEDECRTADWQLIGFSDGTKGYAVSRISDHQKACAKVGVSPDLSAYKQGRDEGLLDYCRPATGYRLGARGGSFNAVCPVQLEAEFSEGYRYGKAIYLKKSELNSLKRDLVKQQDEHALIAEMIEHKERRLVQDGIPKDKRVRLLEQIKELGADLIYSEERLISLQREMDGAGYELERLKRNNPYLKY
ncbi:MAG: DUF2799 domain-containing protein [Gammaproteobacteria bacterium]|nr:DUF2799 domain-containing protein [Gammaproteobacteria bacterium]